MLDLYYWPTPNGWKVTILLQECGLAYRVLPVNIGRGEQFSEDFLRLSPNNRIPALTDHAPGPAGTQTPVHIFESGAILQYIAEKEKKFLPENMVQRWNVLQWLYWQVGGLGPMAGQNGHFLLYAPERIAYAVDRYGAEVRRLYGVLDAQLARTGAYVAGDYSIADMAIFPWVMTHKAQQLDLAAWPHVRRWFAQVRARDAVQAGLAVGRDWQVPGKPMDEDTRRHLFRGTLAAIPGQQEGGQQEGQHGP